MPSDPKAKNPKDRKFEELVLTFDDLGEPANINVPPEEETGKTSERRSAIKEVLSPPRPTPSKGPKAKKSDNTPPPSGPKLVGVKPQTTVPRPDIVETAEVIEEETPKGPPPLPKRRPPSPSELKKRLAIYFRTKGLDVDIPQEDGPTIKGKLVQVQNPKAYIVVWVDEKGKIGKKELPAKELYEVNPGLESKIQEARANRDLTLTMTSLEDDSRKIKTPTVLDGNEANTLAEAIHHFELSGGIEGVAATFIGGYDPKKGKVNEDRAVVHPGSGAVAVIDGMGGEGNGDIAAEALSVSLNKNPDDPKGAAGQASKKIGSIPTMAKKGAACFLHARPKIGETLQICQAGDVDLWHYDAQGKIKFRPEDRMNRKEMNLHSVFDVLEYLSRTKAKEQQVKQMVVHFGDADMNKAEDVQGVEKTTQRILNGDRPFTKPGETLYRPLRKAPVKAVSGSREESEVYDTGTVVEKGDWIVIASDGVSDNFEPEEIQDIITKAKTPEQATKILSDELQKRLKVAIQMAEDETARVYEGKLRALKADNATIIVMRATGEEELAKRRAA